MSGSPPHFPSRPIQFSPSLFEGRYILLIHPQRISIPPPPDRLSCHCPRQERPTQLLFEKEFNHAYIFDRVEIISLFLFDQL